MGVAEPWQSEVEVLLKDFSGTIYNPRRDNWDSSWEQSITNDPFYEQVRWELQAMEDADIIGMYFDPNTKSPITLVELGLYAKSGKLIVCCPEGFYRKGNVDIVCQQFSVRTCDTKTEFLDELYNIVSEHTE